MAIEAWYMDDSTEDQRLPHKQQPNRPVSSAKLDELGVLHWKVDEKLLDKDPKFVEIKEKRGYNYTDVIEISKEKLPNYEQKIKTFFEEHIHADEEIRFCMAGSGYFDVRDFEDKWIRIHLHVGQLIVLPTGIYHRFTLDSSNYIKAMRLFQGDPVWTPLNRPQETDGTEARKQYVETFIAPKIKKQIEFYFSDSNFRRDKFMQKKSQENEEGWIDISVLLTFNKLKALTQSEEEVAAALKDSESVTVSEDGKQLKRASQLPETDDSKERTVFASGFGTTYTVEEVEKTFKPFGRVQYVRLNRKMSGKDKKLNGSAFIEFEKAESVEKTLAAEEISFNGTPLTKVISFQQFSDEKKSKEGSSAKSGAAAGAAAGAAGEKAEEELTYTEGLIVRLDGLPEGSSREDLKEAFSDFGTVKYVDFSRGQTDGYIRMEEADAAKKAVDTGISVQEKEVQTRLLEGDEEKAYWVNVNERVKNTKNNNKHNNNKKRKNYSRHPNKPGNKKTRFD